jgi:hypothetical protein
LQKQRTLRLLSELFGAKEERISIEKKVIRAMKMETIKLDKPNIRQTKIKESSLV